MCTKFNFVNSNLLLQQQLKLALHSVATWRLQLMLTVVFIRKKWRQPSGENTSKVHDNGFCKSNKIMHRPLALPSSYCDLCGISTVAVHRNRGNSASIAYCFSRICTELDLQSWRCGRHLCRHNVQWTSDAVRMCSSVTAAMGIVKQVTANSCCSTSVWLWRHYVFEFNMKQLRLQRSDNK